jgi:hypothetical protein
MIPLSIALTLLQKLPEPKIDFSIGTAYSSKGDSKSELVMTELRRGRFSIQQTEEDSGFDLLLRSREKDVKLDYKGTIYGRFAWKVTVEELSKRYKPSRANAFDGLIQYEITIVSKQSEILKLIGGKSVSEFKDFKGEILVEKGEMPIRFGNSPKGFVGGSITVTVPELQIQGKGTTLVKFRAKSFNVTSPAVTPAEKIKP